MRGEQADMNKKTATQRPPRGRPRSIDRETVLAAAMKLDDSELNLPVLAESLGTTVTTIYRLFGDKVGLLTAMYAQALRHLDPIEGSSWTTWLDSYVKVLLKLTQRHPFVVALQFSHVRFNDELRNLSEHSLALVRPGVELLMKAGLDSASAYNVLVAIKAIVLEHAHTERVYAESVISAPPLATLGGPGEQRLWQLLKMFRHGIRAEMKRPRQRHGASTATRSRR
jgi:AcrR family transcriptional regulator